MPTERKRVNLSMTPSRIRSLLKFGDDQRMRTGSDRLKVSSICMNIIISILDLYRDPLVQEYLKKKGVNFLNLIYDAVRSYIASNKS